MNEDPYEHSSKSPDQTLAERPRNSAESATFPFVNLEILLSQRMAGKQAATAAS